MRDIRTMVRVTLHGSTWKTADGEHAHREGAERPCCGVGSDKPASGIADALAASRTARTDHADSTTRPGCLRSVQMPAGKARPDEKEPSFVVYVCQQGQLDVTTPSGCLSLADGDACIVSPSDPHTTLAGPTSAYACIEMVPGIIEECLPFTVPTSLALTRYVHARGIHTAVLPHFYNEGIRLLVKRVEHRLSLSPERQGLELRGMIGDLLLALEDGLSASEGGPLQAERVLTFMRDNLATASLRSTAEHFFCHPNSIANLLRRSCGATFSEVLTELRTQRAETLLRTTDLTVQDVAGACGYHNMTHFYEVFRKRYGMRPGEYRQACEVAYPEAETLRSA